MNLDLLERQLSSQFKDLESIESHLSGSYSGESNEAIYTSFKDLLCLMQDDLIQGSWCDLGAGPCHSALLYAGLNPQERAIAIEFVPEKIAYAKRKAEELRLTNIDIIEADLLTCLIPLASVYFFYFPTGIVLDRILDELLQNENDFKLVVIESHGDFLDRLDLEEGLVRLKEISLSSTRHYPYAVVYGRSFVKKRPVPFCVSFKKKFLLIEDPDHSQWFGESFGLEWLKDDLYNLRTPPRSLCWGQVKEILDFDEVPQVYQFWISLRALGELSFLTHDGLNLVGHLRKIIVSPSFVLEISTGERVECGHISTITWDHILCYESSLDYFFLPLAH